MTQPNPPDQTANSGKGKKSRWGTAAVIGLALVVILSLGFAGYSAMSHAVTVTQQQMVTNTQSVYSVQTLTVTTANTVTSLTTLTGVAPAGYGNPYGNYQYCGYYGCYQQPGYYYNYPGVYNWYYNGYYNGYYRGYYVQSPACQPAGNYGNVTCSGYLYQAQNGCTLLAVSTTSNPYPSYATGDVIEYYTLQHLPSSLPQAGSWITVNGQLYQGYNTAPNGASCPNNYIIVNTIS